MRGVDPVVTPPSRGRQDGLPPLDRGHHPLNNPGHGAMDGAAGGLQQLRTGGFGSPPRQVPPLSRPDRRSWVPRNSLSEGSACTCAASMLTAGIRGGTEDCCVRSHRFAVEAALLL